MTQHWHSLAPAQTASELTSDLENGLSTAEAQARTKLSPTSSG